jgi:hypothetical protein
MGMESLDKVICPRVVLTTVLVTATLRPNHHPPRLCYRLACARLLVHELLPSIHPQEETMQKRVHGNLY